MSNAPTASGPESLARARAVADAVLYEGYLLYPYRADSRKNQARWQFGVLGPPGAAEASTGEDSRLATELLLRGGSVLRVTLRFLQLQRRDVEEPRDGHYETVPEAWVGDRRYVSWDEAIAHEIDLEWDLSETLGQVERPVHDVSIDGGEDIETLGPECRLRRTRWPLRAKAILRRFPAVDGTSTLALEIRNTSAEPSGPDPRADAIRHSLLGAHLIVTTPDGEFESLLEPRPDAEDAARARTHHRCFPVLAGAPGERRIMLVSPIILYDYPEIAGESTGPMFDATEIDEILTLRVMAMTDAEKELARATDPLAAGIIDRADGSTAESLAALHGTFRDEIPTYREPDPAAPDSLGSGDKPWWDPAVDSSVDPGTATTVIDGTTIGKGSLVRVHPRQGADAQDIFFRDQVARVANVQTDVDGSTHVGVVLVDDPAADLHDWFGRYFYFAPSELEPLPGAAHEPPPGPDRDPHGGEGARTWKEATP
ncbi:hypothetical protein [Lolliginicoccus suaedae]|uniref:hypothetical protein n=1 Tax=Lolliginicoccus suaedae TaxID=2605429 RepID=UPI001F2875EB|nr:hypothetical protein [Lolliginicoccus suaedae]